MNDYWKAFQSIIHSSEQLQADEYKSSEVKQSATQLRVSVQSCEEELKQSATRLNSLVEACFNDLNRAEDVWNSKPRIAEAAKTEIWEQLGELSGRHFRILHLGNQYKDEAIKQAKESWEEKIKRLKKTWFIDAKQQLKKGVNWGEKDGLVKDIRSEIELYIRDINYIVKVSLSRIYAKEVNVLNDLASNPRRPMVNFINFCDKETKNQYLNKIETTITNINKIFLNKNISTKFNHNFEESIKPSLKILIEKGLGEIKWDEVVNFKKEFYSKIEIIIISFFEERVKVATQALEYAISFYNNFLETQERYQQETLAQCEAEKAWIDQQRQQLEQVQSGINAIIIQSAG